MENSTRQLSMARNENDVHSPADVIKELVNIALAAGANLITVEIFNGGITEFRVSDNAPKFFPEEISPFVKLQETATPAQRGTLLWQRIGYLLREIVPFADVEIAGKSCSSTKTIALHYYHGKYLNEYQTASAANTCIAVKNLFFNVPSKYRQFKSDAHETEQVQDVLRNIALRNLDTSIRLMSNGKVLFKTTGNGVFHECLRSIYETAMVESLISVQTAYEGVQICGYVSSPQHVFRTPYNYLIRRNGSAYDKREIANKVQEIYSEVLPEQRFPFYYLNITDDHAKDRSIETLTNAVDRAIKSAISSATVFPVRFELFSALKSGNRFSAGGAIKAVSDVPDFSRELKVVGLLFRDCVLLEQGDMAYYFSFSLTALRIKRLFGIRYETVELGSLVEFLSRVDVRSIFDADNPVYTIPKETMMSGFPALLE